MNKKNNSLKIPKTHSPNMAILLVYIKGGGPLRPRSPMIRNITNNTKNKKNNIFAIPTAATAIPPKPKAAAMIAITKNIIAQLNMIDSLCNDTHSRRVYFLPFRLNYSTSGFFCDGLYNMSSVLSNRLLNK
jgi:hypothetical protein